MTDHQVDLAELVEGAVSRALDALFHDALAATLTRARVERYLHIVARGVAARARDMAYLDLMTSADMAAELGVSRQRVLALAQRRGIGWRAGRDVVFLRSDIPAMRPGPVGVHRRSG